MLPTHKNYFNNLNGIRFIAASMVLLGHAEILFHASLHSAEQHTRWFEGIANYGVDIFFALSGFLITSLLIKEYEKNKKIFIGHFFLRRCLRIWPLYYLILLLGFTAYFTGIFSPVMNEKLDSGAIPLLIGFQGHIAKEFFRVPLYLIILWSIGIEELFYLMFPFLFPLFRKKVTIMPFVIVSLLLLKIVMVYVFFKTLPPAQSWSVINLIYTVRLENLLIGGYLAFLLYSGKWNVLKNIYVLTASVLLLLFVLMSTVFGINFWPVESISPILRSIVNPFLISFASSLIFFNIVYYKNWLGIFENRRISYAGKVSYGIYMYHPLVLYSLVAFCPLPGNFYLRFIFIFSTGLLLTWLISAVSYELFEKRFLKFSNRFRHI